MLEAARVDCPYCGEPFETVVDCPGDSQDYIEDCPVCCRSVEIHVEIGLNRELESLTARRDDD